MGRGRVSNGKLQFFVICGYNWDFCFGFLGFWVGKEIVGFLGIGIK
jgi:hypothetical protein